MIIHAHDPNDVVSYSSEAFKEVLQIGSGSSDTSN